MPLQSGRAGSGGPLSFLSARFKDAQGHELKQPYFSIARKNDATGEIDRTEETCDKLAAVTWTGIQFKTRQGARGGPVRHVYLYLSEADGSMTYHVDFTYKLATRSVFNAMCSLEAADGLNLSIYRTRRGYEAFYLSQGEGNNEVKVPWKFENQDELPQPFEITDPRNPNKVIETDFSDLDNFFETALRETAERLGVSIIEPKQQQQAQDDGQGEQAPQQAQQTQRTAQPRQQARPTGNAAATKTAASAPAVKSAQTRPANTTRTNPGPAAQTPANKPGTTTQRQTTTARGAAPQTQRRTVPAAQPPPEDAPVGPDGGDVGDDTVPF